MSRPSRFNGASYNIFSSRGSEPLQFLPFHHVDKSDRSFAPSRPNVSYLGHVPLGLIPRRWRWLSIPSTLLGRISTLPTGRARRRPSVTSLLLSIATLLLGRIPRLLTSIALLAAVASTAVLTRWWAAVLAMGRSAVATGTALGWWRPGG